MGGTGVRVGAEVGDGGRVAVGNGVYVGAGVDEGVKAATASNVMTARSGSASRRSADGRDQLRPAGGRPDIAKQAQGCRPSDPGAVLLLGRLVYELAQTIQHTVHFWRRWFRHGGEHGARRGQALL